MSYSEDSFDEDDDDYGILKKALDVELPEDFNPDKIPQTGEEYLQHVIYERAKCQAWLKADIDCSKFKDKQTFKIELVSIDKSYKGAATSLLPTNEWQTSKIEEFTSFRKFIQSKIQKESIVGSFDETEFLVRAQTEIPKFSEISTYTQAGKIRMLQIISKHLDTLEPGTSIEKKTGVWLYAILTLLEKPLSPDSCHTLREFAKRCLVLRSNLGRDSSEKLYMPLNLFICIVARFYNQLDLADL